MSPDLGGTDEEEYFPERERKKNSKVQGQRGLARSPVPQASIRDRPDMKQSSVHNSIEQLQRRIEEGKAAIRVGH